MKEQRIRKSGLTARGVMALLHDHGIADGHYAQLQGYGPQAMKAVLKMAEQHIQCREPGSLRTIAMECERIAADPKAVEKALTIQPENAMGR